MSDDPTASAAPLASGVPLRFEADDPVFDGHFPGRPIVPAAMLLARVVAMADAWQAAQRPGAAPIAEVVQAKFLRPLGPGEDCTVAFTARDGGIRFTIHSAAGAIASGALRVAG